MTKAILAHPHPLMILSKTSQHQTNLLTLLMHHPSIPAIDTPHNIDTTPATPIHIYQQWYLNAPP
jgi:hypothetical protein